MDAKVRTFLAKEFATAPNYQAHVLQLWDRYRDRALVQPFVEGDDVRLSFMDVGSAFADQIGLAQLAKDPDSETGGAFMTMKDNQTLSGAKDIHGARGGFGRTRAAANLSPCRDAPPAQSNSRSPAARPAR